MYKASFQTEQRDINDDNENRNAWAKLQTREGAKAENNGIHLNMDQTDATLLAEWKSQFDNVVSSSTKA